jgi:hypothetical protein
MTEFQLNTPRRSHPFYALDDFAKGYVEAMFFTNGDTGDERENLLNELGVERLTHAAIEDIAKDCNAFLGAIMPDGCFVRQWLDRVANYDDEQAGRDFWFTRQGHGAGFWDREELKGELYAPTADELAHDATLGGWMLEDESAGRFEGYHPKGNIGDFLSEAARGFGEAYVEAYRGWIYHR